MKISARSCAFSAAALLAVAACDQQSISAPISTVSTPIPTPVELGQITILQMTPLAGPGFAITCIRGVNWCNTMLVADVQLHQDVAEPWITASFYNGSQRCGGTLAVRDSNSIDPLHANTITRFTVASMTMSPDENGTFCSSTTRMVVQLWGDRGRSSAPFLTREFAHSWTIFWSDTWDE